ncbi:large conductance mechanosensitive channel protein MscL [Knoellia sp. 3-2P3]|uniref:large conductance mechanosensitive channel protein MscL n=1 Tax=unclassified Knoellia TaxID=2618719 RepID=UPI0023DA65BA|nr:large conductance mechanosensitive channel protein MscL [Knoellia sp. 3-2P3]MDF2093632.1 large conductance mechanosensitive channel protein MscL [Knoellia sp. 3-2P3]
MKGFRDFVMRGNLVELAVAFVMGAAFATVVTAFTAMLMSLLGKVGGQPNFDTYRPGGVPVGVFLTALVSFIIIAAVVYFFVVKPYEAARERFVKQEEDAAPPEDVQLLKEIRDLLAGRPTGTM